MNPRLILAGSGSFVGPVLAALVASDFDIAAVITAADSPAGRGRRLEEQNIAQQAREQGFTVLKPDVINDSVFCKQLAALDAELLLTASYGQFLGRTVRELCPHGTWNLHPSLLPAYRGATPVNAALRDGLTTTGVTLFKMVREMDAGPIAAQEPIKILPTETAGELLARCAALAGQLAVKILPTILTDTITLREQDPARISYAGKLDKNSGHLDWTRKAHEISNQARSVIPWPGAWTLWRGQRLTLGTLRVAHTIQNAAPGTILEAKGDTLLIACGEGSVAASTLQLPGKKMLSVRDFLNGVHLVKEEILR